jgi:hypothetical protein
MTVETPNGTEFSIGAKLYLCAGRIYQPAGMMFGYPTPQGPKADQRTLAKDIFGVTLDWLENSGVAQVGPAEQKIGFQRLPVVMVRAVYSGAPGLSGAFLEKTGWVDASLVDIADRMLPRAQAPFIDFLDGVSREFADAGILTRGGYAAHGNVWNAEWLAYLTEAWLPEVWGVLQRTQARADWDVVKRNVMHAVALSQHTERDFDDD